MHPHCYDMDWGVGLHTKAVEQAPPFELISPCRIWNLFGTRHNKELIRVARPLMAQLICSKATVRFRREHDRTLILDDWGGPKRASFDTASPWLNDGLEPWRRLGNCSC